MFLVYLLALLLSVFLIFYTYVLFPYWISNQKTIFPDSETVLDNSLKVAVLMAAYNEEEVIEKKIISTFDTSFPKNNLFFIIGTDCCSDATDSKILELKHRFSNLIHVPFENRTGKPQILNQLYQIQKTQIDADILILTDADTFFEYDTITELIKPFNNPQIGGVQANFEVYSEETNDVSNQEKKHNKREANIKKGEGVFGAVIGATGACYAILANLFKPVPKGFLVDDFFIFHSVLESGYKTVFSEKAKVVYEISGNSSIEYKRKIRMSIGNFQNFFHFKCFWNPFSSMASLLYWSHKVLRWFTPFLLILSILFNILLAIENQVFVYVLMFQIAAYSLYFVDMIFSLINIKIDVIRFVSHFIKMNVALLIGFFKFTQGNSTSFWNTKNK